MRAKIAVVLLLTAPLFVQNESGAISSYHSVQFYENASASDSNYATQTANSVEPLNLESTLLINGTSNHFQNSGHAFVSWNTQADGNGVTYQDGQNYDFGSATNTLVLYAIWSQGYHSVQFCENASASDSITALQTADKLTNLTPFSALSPQFSRQGFMFSGWNTSPNGTGTAYGDGAPYSFAASLVLYAQWTANALVTITFDLNGGNSGPSPMSGPAQTSITLPASTSVLRPGYVFNGWSTAPTGGTIYLGGQAFALTTSTTLYAQWLPSNSSTVWGSIFLHGKASSLSPAVKRQIAKLANSIKSSNTTLVTLFGFTSRHANGATNRRVSAAYANSVAAFLRTLLRLNHVTGVTVQSSGETTSVAVVGAKVEVLLR
jgi:uncharacterized repeat protein (TIGR02543 family)